MFHNQSELIQLRIELGIWEHCLVQGDEQHLLTRASTCNPVEALIVSSAAIACEVVAIEGREVGLFHPLMVPIDCSDGGWPGRLHAQDAFTCNEKHLTIGQGVLEPAHLRFCGTLTCILVALW